MLHTTRYTLHAAHHTSDFTGADILGPGMNPGGGERGEGLGAETNRAGGERETGLGAGTNPAGGERETGLGAGTNPAGGERETGLGAGTNPAGGEREVGLGAETNPAGGESEAGLGAGTNPAGGEREAGLGAGTNPAGDERDAGLGAGTNPAGGKREAGLGAGTNPAGGEREAGLGARTDPQGREGGSDLAGREMVDGGGEIEGATGALQSFFWGEVWAACSGFSRRLSSVGLWHCPTSCLCGRGLCSKTALLLRPIRLPQPAGPSPGSSFLMVSCLKEKMGILGTFGTGAGLGGSHPGVAVFTGGVTGTAVGTSSFLPTLCLTVTPFLQEGPWSSLFLQAPFSSELCRGPLRLGGEGLWARSGPLEGSRPLASAGPGGKMPSKLPLLSD